MLRTLELRKALRLQEQRARHWFAIFLALFSFSVGLIHISDWQEDWIWIPALMLIVFVGHSLINDPVSKNSSSQFLWVSIPTAVSMASLLIAGLVFEAPLIYWLPCILVWLQAEFSQRWSLPLGLLFLLIFIPVLLVQDLAIRGGQVVMLIVVGMVTMAIHHLARSGDDRASGVDLDAVTTCLARARLTTDLRREMARNERQQSVLGIVTLAVTPNGRTSKSQVRLTMEELSASLLKELPSIHTVYSLERNVLAVLMPMFNDSDRKAIKEIINQPLKSSAEITDHWIEALPGDPLDDIWARIEQARIGLKGDIT